MMGSSGWKQSVRSVALATTLLVAGAFALIGCQGDDSASSSSSSGGSSGDVADASVDTSTPDGGAPDAGLTTATPTFSPAEGTYTSSQSVAIASTTPNAAIYFTTDGTIPTPASIRYTTPIAVTQTTTIRALATAPDHQDSPVATATYTINIPSEQTAGVDFDPPAGTHANTVQVSLSSTETDATICYTTDGATPACDTATEACDSSSATYNPASPVTVTESGTTLNAIACKTGKTNSSVSSATYDFKAADVTVQPLPGIIESGTAIVLSSVTSSAIIRYTLDGSEPSCSSGLTVATPSGSTAPIVESTTIRTLVCKNGYANSEPGTFVYEVRAGAPTISPVAGLKNDTASVSIGLGTNATFACYTTDGSEPACSAGAAACTHGTVYAGAFDVSSDNTTVRAVNCGAKHITSTPTVDATYHFRVGTVAVNGDTLENFFQTPHGTLTSVALTTPDTAGSTICYRVDGIAPTCSAAAADPASVTCGAGSATYSAPFDVTAPFTVKAVGCKPFFQNSDTRDVTFADAAASVALDMSPSPGLYHDDVSLTLSAQPAGATICYQAGAQTLPDPVCNLTNGTCTVGSTYSVPLSLDSNATWIKARACKVGISQPSTLSQGEYYFQVATPVATHGTSTLPPGTTVTFSTQTSGAELRYTLGNPAPTPTCSGGNTSGAYTIAGFDGTVVQVKVIGCRNGFQPSAVSTWTYTTGTIAPPEVNIPGGTYYDTRTVHLSASSSGATIPGSVLCYSMDGTPTCDPGETICTVDSGVVYSAPASAGKDIPITVSGTHLRARTCAPGYPPSAPISHTYTLNVSPLEVSVPGGTFPPSQAPVNVTLRQVNPPPLTETQGPKTQGAFICYSTNGSAVTTDPACTSSGARTCVKADSIPFSFSSASTSLRYRGCKPGLISTDEGNHSYSIDSYARTISIDGNLDFVDAENLLATSHADYKAWVSWDASHIFVGVQGTGVGTFNAANYVHFYIRGVPTGVPNGAVPTTTPDDLGAGEFGNTPLPTQFTHHVFWRTDNGQSGARYWNGTGYAASALPVNVASGGIGATSYVEFSIPRTGSLNSPTNVFLVGAYTAGGTNVASFPGPSLFGHWLEAPLSTYLPPNTAAFVRP